MLFTFFSPSDFTLALQNLSRFSHADYAHPGTARLSSPPDVCFHASVTPQMGTSTSQLIYSVLARSTFQRSVRSDFPVPVISRS